MRNNIPAVGAIILMRRKFSAFIDAYLIAIGAAGILWMFPVMFLDQLRKNALVSRVWFECVWVGLFWLLNLGEYEHFGHVA